MIKIFLVLTKRNSLFESNSLGWLRSTQEARFHEANCRSRVDETDHWGDII